MEHTVAPGVIVRALALALVSLVMGIVVSVGSAQTDEQTMYALFQQRAFSRCEAQCRKILKSDPKHAAARHVLGRTLLARGNHGGAIKELELCLALDPQARWMVQWSHVALGDAHAAQGRKKKARAHYQKAIDIGASQNATRVARRGLMDLGGGEAKLPEFTFYDLDGRTVDQGAFTGHPVIFKFGPSW